jgi:hypothetical protein
MMNHMLMADVTYLDASTLERTGICLPLVAQQVETRGVAVGIPERSGARRGDKRGSFMSKPDGR